MRRKACIIVFKRLTFACFSRAGLHKLYYHEKLTIFWSISWFFITIFCVVKSLFIICPKQQLTNSTSMYVLLS